MATSASALLTIDVQEKDVQKLLLKLSVTTSPIGVGQFLRHGAHSFLQQRAAERFDDEGDAAVGGKWKPLAEATERWREFEGFAPQHPINKRTGELERHLIAGAAYVMEDPAGATLAFPGPGGPMLDEKMRAAAGNKPGTPARRVLGFDSSDIAAILVGLMQFVETGNSRGGLRRAG